MQFKKVYDPKTESKWRKYDDAEFLVAPLFNPRHKVVITEVFNAKEALGLQEEGSLVFGDVIRAKEALARMNDMYSKAIVFDWKGVLDDNGKEVKFTHEKAHELMNNDSDFASWLIQQANEVLIEKFAKKEELTKN